MVYFPTAFMTIMVALLFGGAVAAPVPTLEIGSSSRVPLHPGNMESVQVFPRGRVKDFFSTKKHDVAIQDSHVAAGASTDTAGVWKTVKDKTTPSTPLHYEAKRKEDAHNLTAQGRLQKANQHASPFPWNRPNAERSSAESKAITDAAIKSAKQARGHLVRLGVSSPSQPRH